jgi:uncharacterized protein YciI
MKTGQTLYIRTDFKVEGKEITKKDFNDHIAYLEEIASKRLFMGGGYVNAPGGMIIYHAENLEEAKIVAEGDPIISRGLFTYELKEWSLVLLSDELKY